MTALMQWHVQAVDNLLLTREAIACVAKKEWKLACFLPKLSPTECGSGAHCHISLQNVRTSALAHLRGQVGHCLMLHVHGLAAL